MTTNVPRVLLISTGGTIAMTTGSDGSISPTLSGDDLTRAIPQLQEQAELVVVQYARMPGASLTLQNVIEIANIINERRRGDVAGAIVIQGTDTIEETAYVLDTLVVSGAPVVVTGAMRSASAPGADGPANLYAAVTVALSHAARDIGVLVVMNDEIHAARYVQKSHTFLPSAFCSPGFAPIGRVVEGDAHIYARLDSPEPLHAQHDVDGVAVALIKVGLGDDGRLLSALPDLDYRGVVIEAMGVGHLPSHFSARVEELSKAMPVVLSTRVSAGPILRGTYGFVGGEIDLIARGAIPGGYLSGTKCCLLLRLLLAAGFNSREIRDEFDKRGNWAFRRDAQRR